MRLEDMAVEVEHRFAAAPDAVWQLLTDVERMAGLGPEHVEATWTSEPSALGATFTGTNRVGDRRWQVPCTVVVSERPTAFGWVVGDVRSPSSTWTYELVADGGSTRVRQSFAHGPGFSFVRAAVEASPDEEEAIVAARADGLRRNMAAVLATADAVLRARHPS